MCSYLQVWDSMYVYYDLSPVVVFCLLLLFFVLFFGLFVCLFILTFIAIYVIKREIYL